MKHIFVNTAHKTRQVKRARAQDVTVGSFCDMGTVYKIVSATKCTIFFCE